MTAGLLLSRHVTLPALRRAGRLDRVLEDVAPFRQRFETVVLLGSAGNAESAPSWLSCAPVRAARRLGCDVIRALGFTAAPMAWLAAVMARAPLVLSYAYDHDAVARANGHRTRCLLYAVVRRAIVPRAALVLVPTGSLRDLVERAGAREVMVVPNGVDLRRFTPGSLAGAGPVLAVGRDAPEKRVAVARRACVALGVEFHHVETVPYAAMPHVYRSARAFVLPSVTEGSPKALWEAMATGLPCAVSRGVLADHDLPVVRFDVDDVAGCRDALRRCLDPEYGRGLGAEARRYVERHHDAAALAGWDADLTRGVAEAWRRRRGWNGR